MSTSKDRFTIAELDRMIANLIRTAKITELDPIKALVTVKDGDWDSDWLPWVEVRAHEEATWSPPKVGEQVVVLSPSGDLEQGIVFAGIPSNLLPPPSDIPTQSVRRWADGAIETHDAEDQTHHLTLPATGLFKVTVGPSSIEIDAAGIRLVGPRIDLN